MIEGTTKASEDGTRLRTVRQEEKKKVEAVRVGQETFYVYFRVTTICEVVGPSGERVGIGSSEWSLKDKFDYDRGRKLALRKALIGRNDGYRKEFWEGWLELNRKKLEGRINGELARMAGHTKAVKEVTKEFEQDVEKTKRGVFGCRKR